LKDPNIVKFIAQQKVNTTVFVPAKAAEIARKMRSLVDGLADPSWLTAFEPYLAAKTINQPETIRAIFSAGFKADVASIAEADLCLWAGKGLITAEEGIEHSNVWVNEPELRELLDRGVRSFVVDKKNALDWLAGQPDIKVTLRIRVLDSLGAGQGNKFGMPLESLREMAQYAASLGLKIEGVAFHVGSHAFITERPGESPFDNYANAIRTAAPLCNELHREGLIGPVVNTEGGYRPAYADPEYFWEDVMYSQAMAFRTTFKYPVIWRVEPGRLFGPCAVAKILVNNVDDKDKLRGGKYQYIGLGASLYVGAHDLHWDVPLFLRESDIRSGRVYTLQSHPQEFEPYIAVGYACAGSDQIGLRDNRENIMLPNGLKAGEVLCALPFGAYTSASLGPQSYQEMEGRYQGPNYGFNGIPWPTNIAYPGYPLD